MSDNWIVQNLENALETWNEKLSEIWQLITQSPENFKGGTIWNVIVNIHGAVQAIGLALLVLFFVVGVMRTCGSFAEVKKPEHALKLFIRFALAKGAVTYGLELMMALFNIVQGLISTIMNAAGFGTAQQTVLPSEIVTAVEDCGFFESIPLWAVTLIGGLFITVLSFIMVAELCELNRNMMLSVDIIPVPTDEAVREVENRLLGVETNITNWQRKQNQNNNFSAVVPYDLEQQRKESKEFLDDLTTRDQRMMFAVLTMVHTADSKEQLDSDTEALLTTARKHLCQFAVLKYQQMDGLNTVLPFGVRKIDALRTLTTESLAVFIPFRVQEIYHENGVYYGQNVISKNMIIANRRHLLNGNSFILGVSGAGKSFTAKEEMTNIILTDPNADIIIIDPEREYSPLVKAMQGEVIHISATSENHINAMDMNSDYGDGANPVILKSEFILSLCEQLIGGSSLGAKQKSIIDRCTASVYRYYQQGNYMGTPPTLQDFREELLKQDEPEAQEIALAIELFTDGSLNTFAKHTNVDTHSRLICYDILDLGKQLQPIGMLVVLDSILNRITQNRAKGRNTFIFIDEIYLLFQHEYSANFLFTLWKRVRKYGAYCTGITQNVDVRPDRALCKAV